jgi:hypothetical protein
MRSTAPNPTKSPPKLGHTLLHRDMIQLDKHLNLINMGLKTSQFNKHVHHMPPIQDLRLEWEER